MARSRKPKIELDGGGIEEVAKSAAIRSLIRDRAEDVADLIDGYGIKVGDRNGSFMEEDLPVTTGHYVTDRAHSVVTLAHPSGLAVQAKHGALTKAATQAGLELGGREMLEYVTKAGVRRSATRAQIANWSGGRLG